MAVDIVGALLAKAIKSNSLSYKKPSEGSIEIVVALIVKEVVSGNTFDLFINKLHIILLKCVNASPPVSNSKTPWR